MRTVERLGLVSLMTMVALGAAVACSSSDAEGPQGAPSNEVDAATKADGDTDADASDGDTDADLPDADTDADSPDGDTDADLPDADVPDGDTDADVPDGDTDADVPDGDTDADVPDADTDADVPDGDTDADVPDADSPDADTDADAPDAGEPIAEDLWIKSFANAFPQSLLVVPDTGEIVVGGTLSDDVDFGDGLHEVEEGKTAGFFAKFDKDGNAIFSQHWNGVSTVRVGIDSKGAIYVAGTFVDTIDFGDDELTSEGAEDIFLAKFTSSGTYIDSKRFGGEGSDELHALDVSPSDQLSLTGSFSGTVNFGGDTLSTSDWPPNAGFVARFDDDLEHLVSNQLSIEGSWFLVGSVAAPAEGNISVAVESTGWVRCESSSISSPYFCGVVALDGSGECKWFKHAGLHVPLMGPSGAIGVALDSNGDTLAVCRDAFVRYGANGSVKSSQQFGGTGNRNFAPFRVDGGEQVAVCGTFDGDIEFDDETVSGSGVSALFLAFDRDGEIVARRIVPGASEVSCKALAPSLTAATYVATGNFDGEVDLGNGPVNGKGMYLGKVKLNP